MTSYNLNATPDTPMTYVHPWYIQQLKLENITTCESESTQNPQQVTLGQRRTDLSGNRKGDIAEQYVCLIAQWKGAEVFTNTGCDGKTDLVLKIEDQLVEIDVKLARWQEAETGSYSWRSSQASLVNLPVYPVLVIPEGDIMEWKIRWKKTSNQHSPPHCPPGLENFWSKTIH